MNELPLYDIDIYGSWETFIEFWELMGKPKILFNDNYYDSIMMIEHYLKSNYYIFKINQIVEIAGGTIEYINNYPINIPIGDEINRESRVIQLTINRAFIEEYYADDLEAFSDTYLIDYYSLSLNDLLSIYNYIK